MSALINAASATGLVEQIGSYAGLASTIGLAIMALLYFSQAREVRRLREWAGREPERAAELAQRVQSDSQRRVVAAPMQPATPAAAQQQATAALYASVGATPPGTVAPPGQLARPAATPAAGLLPSPGVVPQPGAANPAPAGAAAAPAAAAATGAAPPEPAAPPVPGAAAPKLPAPAATPTAGGPANATPSAPAPGRPAGAAPAAAASRTAAAQRSASLSSYANGSIGQDTRESAAARPEPLRFDDDDGGGLTKGRIALYVGGGLTAMLVAVVLLVVLTSGEDTQPPNDFGNTPTAQEPAGGSPAPGTQGRSGAQGGAGASASLTPAERRATKVAVLNGTTQTGLARSVGDKIEKARFTIASIGTNADQQIPATIVSYSAGHEPAARTVAKIVGVSSASVQPADANASASADADVVVTVGLDQTG